MIAPYMIILYIVILNFVLTIMFRKESRDDWRHSDALIHAIKDEMKDFHGRLCSIEEKRLAQEKK